MDILFQNRKRAQKIRHKIRTSLCSAVPIACGKEEESDKKEDNTQQTVNNDIDEVYIGEIMRYSGTIEPTRNELEQHPDTDRDASPGYREGTDDDADAVLNAARDGDVAFLQRLISAMATSSGTAAGGASQVAEAVNRPRLGDGATPLLLASQNGHEEAVRLLLANGAKPEGGSGGLAESAGGEAAGTFGGVVVGEGHSPLLLAANMGHACVVSLLLQALASSNRVSTVVNETDNDGATPLLLASQNGHLQVVDLLLKAGARGDITMDGGRSALLLASQQGHALVVGRLLKTFTTTTTTTGKGEGADAGVGGANAADDDGLTPLFAAAHQGHTAVVLALLAAGALPNKSQYLGYTAEGIARAQGHGACEQAFRAYAAI